MRPVRFRKALAGLLGGLLLASGCVWADTIAVEYTSANSAGVSFIGFVAGYEFVANAGIMVTQLGALLEPETFGGFYEASTAVEVGLWDSAGTLLVSTTVFNTDPLTGHFHYRPVFPVPLGVGAHYTVAGLYGVNKGFQPSVDGLVTAPEITYLAARGTTTNILIQPTMSDPFFDQLGPDGYYGGNFQFQPVVVPEPSSLTLCLLALVSWSGYRWWQQRARGRRHPRGATPD